MVSGGTFYTIRDDQSHGTTEFLETVYNYDQKIKESEEKRRKEQQVQEQQQEDRDAMFRAAHFICTGGPGPHRSTIIPRTPFSEGAIQAHKENCDWCQKNAREEKERY